MLRIQDLTKSYGSQTLFEDASFQMTPGERLGLVGRNGHGKSTLFKLILKEELPDSGKVTYPQNYRIGHLAQHLHFTQPTVLEEGCLGLSEEEQYDHYKVEQILSGLGFSEEDFQRPPSSFSGGFQIRLNLAKVLVSKPNLLLLDEPTNYLDIVSIRWITDFLNSWRDELIIVSHDREFMDSVTTHTAMIHRKKLHKVQGNTEKIYTKIAQEEELYEKTRVSEDKRRKEMEAFITRFRAQASKAASVQSRVKMLEKMGTRDQLDTIHNLDFAFHYEPIQAKTLMEVKDLSFHYKPEQPLIQNLSLTIQSKDRIAVIGKNGKGKSTLLNLLANEMNPLQGNIQTHPNLKIGYFGQTNINRLHPNLTVEDEVQQANADLTRTQVRGLCGVMMFSGDHAEKKISVLSGGEKSRVLLARILATPANLLFLDEPTNHLDMQSIEALIESIQDFEGAVVIVTHSEMILREVATKLVLFQHETAELFDGTYQDFLEKIGWEEEEGNKKKSKPSKTETKPSKEPIKSENKKEIRKQRSEIIAEKSKILTPLKNEMTKLEEEICSLESESTNLNQQMLDASQSQKIDQFVILSKQIKEIKEKIDQKFNRLEEATKKYEEKNRDYEEMLKDS